MQEHSQTERLTSAVHREFPGSKFKAAVYEGAKLFASSAKHRPVFQRGVQVEGKLAEPEAVARHAYSLDVAPPDVERLLRIVREQTARLPRLVVHVHHGLRTQSGPGHVVLFIHEGEFS